MSKVLWTLSKEHFGCIYIVLDNVKKMIHVWIPVLHLGVKLPI